MILFKLTLNYVFYSCSYICTQYKNAYIVLAIVKLISGQFQKKSCKKIQLNKHQLKLVFDLDRNHNLSLILALLHVRKT
jgi:hypothetical protein